ncbi:endo-1,4-beta xylanase [Stereum hirsutum FP-91666 SS1]|uniref:endo-1,4-beta xylanase n=1 Tax=Stereum hirsutum (strain FP-91666) TaxID=721885 RepID=UPI0004449CC2|nr:endo-1,4-beta xylanase [Stereum hirsutum FP-91666 SS1]EIM84086.1 endo-1,4-beta xylanase [Stereum hirsutum FP-91666 SS1]
MLTTLVSLVSLFLIPLRSYAAPSATSSAAPNPGATSTASLNSLAQSIGKAYFGSATDNPEFTDAAYLAILSDNAMFGQITPANAWKWDATEPEQGVFTFTQADQVAALAQGNGQLIRGHNCVWHQQLPTWVSSGNFTAAELTDIMTTHCTTILEHFKGDTCEWRLIAFDIVNEPFNDDGTFTSDVFFNTLGSSYIGTVLTAARAADPSTHLYINEFNLEFAGVKSTAMANLVSSLKSAGTPLDGIGFESHLIVGQVPTDFQQQLESFTALGVEVAVTELDIRMTLPVTDALLAQQQADYQSVVSACKAVSGCVGVTIWDYTDKFSWIPGAFAGQGAACPWDDNLVKKPAFDGIVAGLQS